MKVSTLQRASALTLVASSAFAADASVIGTTPKPKPPPLLDGQLVTSLLPLATDVAHPAGFMAVSGTRPITVLPCNAR